MSLMSVASHKDTSFAIEFIKYSCCIIFIGYYFINTLILSISTVSDRKYLPLHLGEGHKDQIILNCCGDLKTKG